MTDATKRPPAAQRTVHAKVQSRAGPAKNIERGPLPLAQARRCRCAHRLAPLEMRSAPFAPPSASC